LREKFRQKRIYRDRQWFLFPEFYYEPLKRKRARAMVDSLFEIMKSRLERGDYILISGFGKFQVKFKWARKARNPKTGEQIFVNSKRIVTFRCSDRLKKRLNQ